MIVQYLKRGSHNAFFYGISSALVRGISFLFLPYFLSRLTLSEFGIWDFYQMFFSMGTMVLTSCASTGMIRFFLLYKDDPRKQSQAIGNALCMVAVGAVIFPFIAAGLLHQVYPAIFQSNYLVITLCNISLFALFSMVLAFMRMREKLVWYSALFCGQNVLATGMTVLLVAQGYGVQSFFYASTAAFIIFLPLFFLLLYRYHSFSGVIFKEQLRYSVPLLAYGFLYTGFYSIDRFFIKYNDGFETLGMYGILGRFGMLFQFFSVALMDAWPVVLFNAQKEKEGDYLISKLLSYFLLVLTTGGIVAMVASSFAIHWFLAEKYWGIASLLSLYFLPLVLLEGARVLQVGFALSTKTFLSPLLALFGLGMQGACLWMLQGFGIRGIMVANAVAFTVYGVASLVMSKRSYSKTVISTPRVAKIMGLFVIYGIALHGLLATGNGLAQVGLVMSWPIVLWLGGVVERDEKKWVYKKIGARVQNYITRNQMPASANAKNILYLRTDINFQEVTAGGSVAHTLGVINGFKELGYNIFCASSSMQTVLKSLELPYFQELEVYPVFALLRWKLGHLRWRLDCFFANLFFTVQLLKVIKQQPLTSIYQRYSLLNCVGLILSKFKGVPLILEYNGSEVWVFDAWSEHRWFKLTRLARAIESLNVRYADFIVVVSQPIKDDLVSKGVDAAKILVNPNGVDPALFDPEKLLDVRNKMRRELGIENRFVFGFIGTFSYWHGIEVLADIIPLLAKQNPRAHFLLIGDGPLKNYLVDVVSNASAASHVTFTGLVPQHSAKNYLAACDAFLCPTQPNKDGTRFFGSPTKLFEYMSMGKPIIASDLEQLSELLEPSLSSNNLDEASIQNQIGILVSPQDTQGFFRAAQKLLELDDVRIKTMGAHAREKVENRYSWKKHVENIQSFCRNA